MRTCLCVCVRADNLLSRHLHVGVVIFFSDEAHRALAAMREGMASRSAQRSAEVSFFSDFTAEACFCVFVFTFKNVTVLHK